MNGLQIFNFGNLELRTRLIDGEPWLVGKDVADALGYQNGSRDVNRHVDMEDRLALPINDGVQNREMIFINESGMFSLVFGSKLKTAKEFKRWVTSVVLPTIRKTGGYQLPTEPEDIMIETLQTQKEIKQRLSLVSEDVEGLKLEIDLNRVQKKSLSDLVKRNVMSSLGGKKSNAYKELKGKVFAEHWRSLKNAFEVASYEEIPKLKYAEAMEMAEMWVPSMELAYEIKKANS